MSQRGAYAGTPTDQHLPYGTIGFRDVDIYPSRPNLQRARELALGHTGNGQGVLYCSNRAPAPQQCQIIQANLRAIGLEMEIKLFPRAEQFERTGRRGEPFDMTLEGWHMDYFDPFDFLFLLDGTTLKPTNNLNFAYFNDPGYNSRIQAANQLHGDARAQAFGDLDVEIAQTAAPWAPYGVTNDRLFFSARIGCQAYVPPVRNLARSTVRAAGFSGRRSRRRGRRRHTGRRVHGLACRRGFVGLSRRGHLRDLGRHGGLDRLPADFRNLDVRGRWRDHEDDLSRCHR